MSTISASSFKAKCLALLDEVAETGLPITVTKRGKPVARVVPIGEPEPTSLLGSVSYESEADLLAPIDDTWEADR
jgi:prevent-host-death family protein